MVIGGKFSEKNPVNFISENHCVHLIYYVALAILHVEHSGELLILFTQKSNLSSYAKSLL